MKDTLITRDSKGKIRIVNISCEWNDKLHSYIISRNTSQLGGKVTEQPLIEINKGKVKRTVTEQAKLEYNSHVKKYLDKGYKNIKEFGYNSIDEFDPDSIMPEEIVDTNGAKKPMLAKKYSDVAISVFEKIHYASKKLDGVRMMLRNDNGTLRTSSRGGGDYDIPSTHILLDKTLQQFMIDHPDLILDGELYVHGETLQSISGMCRKITLEPEHVSLKYWIYDIAGTDKPFKERLEILQEMENIFNDSNKIVICEHVKTISWSDIDHLHNKWVEEGYEGCVIRNPDKEYGYGKKDNRMIKIKKYDDGEFKITGMTEGKLREEDFVFNLVTEDGKQFEAKPKGTRELRQEYRDNIETIIGQMGTVQYFGFTPEGIPNLPIFKYIRYGDDND